MHISSGDCSGQCMNDGRCESDRCVCQPSFTGELCQTLYSPVVDSSDSTQQPTTSVQLCACSGDSSSGGLSRESEIVLASVLSLLAGILVGMVIMVVFFKVRFSGTSSIRNPDKRLNYSFSQKVLDGVFYQMTREDTAASQVILPADIDDEQPAFSDSQSRVRTMLQQVSSKLSKPSTGKGDNRSLLSQRNTSAARLNQEVDRPSPSLSRSVSERYTGKVDAPMRERVQTISAVSDSKSKSEAHSDGEEILPTSPALSLSEDIKRIEQTETATPPEEDTSATPPEEDTSATPPEEDTSCLE